MRVIVAFAVAFGLAAASTPAGPPHDAKAQAKLDKLLNGRVAGEAKKCVPVAVTNSATAIDGYTLAFRDGPRVWINNLTANNGCEMIGKPYAMETESRVRQVCGGSTVNVLDMSESGGGMPVGACTLGEFIPYTKP
jgi:hypothetical protein